MLARMNRCGVWAIVIGIAAPVARAEVPSAELRDGHWLTVTPAASQPAADAELDHVQQLLRTGDAAAALDLAQAWVARHGKKAANPDRAIYLLAQANYQLDDRIRSFYFLDELMDEYPESGLFYPALQRQYDIADAFLNGHKTRFLGLSLVPAEEEAVEMLFRIQQRSPGSALAEKSLLRTADYYYASGEFLLAHDAYGYFIKNYPRSPELPRVKLRQAFSSLAQYRGVQFDPTAMLDARAELSDIIVAYPAMAREENLVGLIGRIDQALSRKLLFTADYYRRTRKLRAAVFMYRYLLTTYPAGPDVQAAKDALAGMPKEALGDANPTPGQGPVMGPPTPTFK